MIEMVLEYSNLDHRTQRAGWYNREMHATLRPKVKRGQWAGDGPTTVYNTYPTGPVRASPYPPLRVRMLPGNCRLRTSHRRARAVLMFTWTCGRSVLRAGTRWSSIVRA